MVVRAWEPGAAPGLTCHNRAIGDLTLDTTQGPLRAYLASPDGDGPTGAVLVLHEAFGLTDEMRGHADHLAGAGYLALAPDLYSWGPRVRCVAATMVALTRRQGRVFADIEAGRRFLADHERSNGNVGVIGFCMGGGLALAAAPAGGFAAAAPNYGQVPRDAERTLAGICPVVASFGARDPMLRGHAERLEVALDALGVEHDLKVYPGATHGFMNTRSGAVPRASEALLRLRYDPAAADDTWERILGFFGRHLTGQLPA